MKKLVFVLSILSLKLFSQSASVFDASYFNLGNTSPLIEVGKGINITDVYKPTKHCFVGITPKLKPAQGGQKTSINYYYTKNEAQYNTLKNQGTSGQISYLNMFSIGGSSSSYFSSKSSAAVERIIIIAKVDFGIYTLSGDPQLNPEAKNLIAKSKYSDFIDQYGTHYIYGVRKESSIWITLTKKSGSVKNKTTYGTSFNEEFSPPEMVNFKIGMTDDSEIETTINTEQYDVSVEIKGPSIKGDNIKSGVDDIMSGNGENKLGAISKFIDAAFANISDPNQAQITQYYYNPFTLYNLKVIQWNEKKLNQLVKINENVVKLTSSKSNIDKLTSPEGTNYVSTKFDKDIGNFQDKEQYKTNYIQAYNTILPNIITYKIEVDTTLKYLEKIYNKCSDIFCNLDSVCGMTGPYEERVALLNSKIKNEISKMSKIKHDAWMAANKENTKPECEKEGISYLFVVNVSSNPYDFYQGDNYIERIPGKTTMKYKLKPGVHNLKAQQVSGYVMYATVNNRSVNIENICSEVTIKVGFEE
jgi:hypothetical protein